ncbi:MAG: esterase-like activity of phytase family protein [Pseudanabaenaceae cyanobacterium SKYGB_i_bin29]|nr:esterase-like activity of phytase family protein [Pseudanabaenaceae cyanobacterium SKYG29]MDW8420256.1 esterase-like activity of phytase family protein [Pseudanabaenaceae cyanobacterium SKYGB_i_bin29]
MTTRTVRFAQFNIYTSELHRREGQFAEVLSNPDSQQLRNVAETIQRINPDVILLNEFDYLASDPLRPVRLFQQNYLSRSQNGAPPIEFPFVYVAPSNTGIPSGFDLNNDGRVVTTPGTVEYGNDAFGFGFFPGQYGMVVLSKFPIDVANVRTFQNFLWKDMPNNLLTNDPTVDDPATPVNENLRGFYSQEEINVLRLSSKSHWDVPININGTIVHFLVCHPTPPVFDGPEDRNGKRNFDEIRFWADYINPAASSYIYDDNGRRGGLPAGRSFVIAGDLNADPFDGDSYNNAARQLTENPRINNRVIPSSLGGLENGEDGGVNDLHRGDPRFDTTDFNDRPGGPGNLRIDYVLPSADLSIRRAEVFWPPSNDPLFRLVGSRGDAFSPFSIDLQPTSDHSAVFVDIDVPIGPGGARNTVTNLRFIGQATFFGRSLDVANTEFAGISGIAYDDLTKTFYALSDARTEDEGPTPRFYTLKLDLNPTSFGNANVKFGSVTILTDPQGRNFAPLSLDPEGIALSGRGTVYISSEGEASAARVTAPFIKEFDLYTGRELRSLPIPDKYIPNGFGANQTRGVRNNLAFESLALTPNGRQLYTATEGALVQDGPEATATNSTRARILRYDLLTGRPDGEFLYVADPIVLAPTGTNFAVSGLVDLLPIDDRGTLLALERSFTAGTPGTGNSIKLYEITLDNATDISRIDSLNALTPQQLRDIRPVEKRLLLNFDSLRLPTGLDNIEGMVFGPLLPNGQQSLIIVSDNNFNKFNPNPTPTFTQIMAFAIDIGAR